MPTCLLVLVQAAPAAASPSVKDKQEEEEEEAVQEAEDSEPEGSEVSYGSDEPPEFYQSDADSDDGTMTILIIYPLLKMCTVWPLHWQTCGLQRFCCHMARCFCTPVPKPHGPSHMAPR